MPWAGCWLQDHPLGVSLLDETEAGEWENCWHLAGVLFETLPESWDAYRQWALKFYNSSDIEYHRPGSVPWNGTQPPHMSAQSDLYWAMRVGFADAHSQNAGQRRVSLAGIADSLERIETITSGAAQRVLRTERNTDNLVEDLKDRLPPNHEYWYGQLLEELPGLMGELPRATVDHLIDASRYKIPKRNGITAKSLSVNPWSRCSAECSYRKSRQFPNLAN